MEGFSSKTKASIKHYVYGLKDPRNNEYFYIGKINIFLFKHVENIFKKC